jgi:hypothetical protein
LILVDTSVWVDHFRKDDPQLTGLLELGVVAMHPFVVGEIACESLGRPVDNPRTASGSANIGGSSALPTETPAFTNPALALLTRGDPGLPHCRPPS